MKVGPQDGPDDPSMESAMAKVTAIAESHGLVFVGAFAKSHGPKLHVRMRIAAAQKDGKSADMVRHCLVELQKLRDQSDAFLASQQIPPPPA